ncbi:conserved hypothetical protein [delta proteobacterium NaphS2]|nr:conserved hypothetical protein [delta proteobacterium NaphS2]
MSAWAIRTASDEDGINRPFVIIEIRVSWTFDCFDNWR